MIDGTTSPSVPARPRLHWTRWLLVLVPTIAAVALGSEVGHMSIGSNLHEVVPDKVYRCSQPDEPRLDQIIARHQIRTVINLRGPQETAPWYIAESRAVSRHDVAHEDISFSAARLPPPHEIRRLAEVFQHADYPLIFHCFRGVDRTGLACGCARLLLTDDTIEEAVRQLGLRYGHLTIGRTRHLISFFDFYREWLEQQGLPHTNANFATWMRTGYCPGACRAEIEPLAPRERNLVVTSAELLTFRVRCKNTSIRPWQMSRDANAGVFLCWGVHDPVTQMPSLNGRAGLFERVVQPGESVEITAFLPRLSPGKYIIRLDMEEAQHCKFYMAGSVPVEWVVEVRP